MLKMMIKVNLESQIGSLKKIIFSLVNAGKNRKFQLNRLISIKKYAF